MRSSGVLSHDASGDWPGWPAPRPASCWSRTAAPRPTRPSTRWRPIGWRSTRARTSSSRIWASRATASSSASTIRRWNARPMSSRCSPIAFGVNGARRWFAADFTLDEIKRLDAGAWFGPSFAGERVPTFQEAIDLVRGKAGLFPELKAPDAVSRTRHGHGDAGRRRAPEERARPQGRRSATPLILQSFDQAALQALARDLPTLDSHVPARAARRGALDIRRRTQRDRDVRDGPRTRKAADRVRCDAGRTRARGGAHRDSLHVPLVVGRALPLGSRRDGAFPHGRSASTGCSPTTPTCFPAELAVRRPKRQVRSPWNCRPGV